MTTRKTKAPQATETPSIPSQEETPIQDTPTPSEEPSALLQAAIDRHEQELTRLQQRMNELSDQFADRAGAIVEQGLREAQTKAEQRIKALILPRFFGSGETVSPSLPPSDSQNDGNLALEGEILC
ncbi:hypothetical protein ACN4EG_13670 [Alkalinema pantanalense CENA528]|uniref:hypothetical protein n=1 Tax=Alkalinema pantanalense TaxID=1620705 RepID=UPI003D6DC6C1